MNAALRRRPGGVSSGASRMRANSRTIEANSVPIDDDDLSMTLVPKHVLS
jgi:hypothetical protein